jgi:hypothetical protein
MKSHLIPEPRPLDQNPYRSASAQLSFPGQARSNSVQMDEPDIDRAETNQHVPEMPMRNFLRVVFVR